jgi:hypothetical protein
MQAARSGPSTVDHAAAMAAVSEDDAYAARIRSSDSGT